MSDLERVAKRVFWWKTPAEALADQRRFLAQVMTYGNLEDVLVTLRDFPRSALREVLDAPPAGVFDPAPGITDMSSSASLRLPRCRSDGFPELQIEAQPSFRSSTATPSWMSALG